MLDNYLIVPKPEELIRRRIDICKNLSQKFFPEATIKIIKSFGRDSEDMKKVKIKAKALEKRLEKD